MLARVAEHEVAMLVVSEWSGLSASFLLPSFVSDEGHGARTGYDRSWPGFGRLTAKMLSGRKVTRSRHDSAMADHISKVSPRLQARIAGFLYLIIIVAGAVGYTTHSNLIVWSDAAR